MKKLRRRLFIFAIIFALLSSGGAYVYLKSLDDTPVVEVETYTILVAARDIPARTVITEEMIAEVEIPYKSESSQFYNTRDEIIGKYVVSKIYAEAQFHVNNIDNGLNEELSLKISGNMRAVSVGVSGSSGVANLIKPGDFVDVVVYLPEVKEGQVVVRPDIAKIILQNVQVLAVNQDLTSESETGDLEVEVEDNASSKLNIVTLSVPVFDVETLVLAKDVGLIDLVLRPLEGDYAYVTEGIIWQELLLDDFDRIKDMFPNYAVNTVGEVYVDPDEVTYEEYVYYTVSYGDTLREISLLFYGSEEYYLLLQQVNNIVDENVISAGMGIKVPVMDWSEDVEED